MTATHDGELVLEVRSVSKDYRGLRPLRIEHLDLRQGQSLSLVGFDRVSAEVLVNLLTGATVPDSGEVRVFGRPTRAIHDGDEWLASVERFGILTERAVLLDALTVQQNLAVPFSLELDPIPEPVRSQVEQLAADVGLSSDDMQRRVLEVSPGAQLRLRLARAVALGPRILISEHPNALVPADALAEFAKAFSALVARRHLASLMLTTDRQFAEAIGSRVLTLQPATGELVGDSRWRRWFSH